MNLFHDSKMDDAKRREELYDGSIFVYSPSTNAFKLCEFAQELIEAAFHPHDPQKVQEHMSVERCVEILADLKPNSFTTPNAKS
jgi:hypothetical protein